jgi:integrase
MPDIERGASRPQRRLTEEELRAFLQAADGEPSADLMRFLALTGVRLGEALALAWGDVDLDAGTAVIRRPTRLRRKGMPTLCLAYRTIDLSEPVLRLLAQRRELAPTGALVFRDARCGARASAREVAEAFRSASLRAGVPDVNPWVLRRTWAGLLLDAGLPRDYVSRSLGHASTAVTAAAQRTPRRLPPAIEPAASPSAAAASHEPAPSWEPAHARPVHADPAHAMMAASARSSTG